MTWLTLKSKFQDEIEVEEEEELEFYDLSILYRLFKSFYLHSYRAYSGKKGETEIGYRDTWNTTTVTLVLFRARSKAPIHGTDMLRPHPKVCMRGNMTTSYIFFILVRVCTYTNSLMTHTTDVSNYEAND